MNNELEDETDLELQLKTKDNELKRLSEMIKDAKL
jgi:uncharacterized protein involved in tolerance to divalent cations